MRDLHLLPPDDDVLPSRRVGWGFGGLMVLVWVVVLGLASQQRASEASAVAAERTVDSSSLTLAPPAKYPGGVDARALDGNASRPSAGARRHAGGGPPAGTSGAQRPKNGGPPPAGGPVERR